MTDISATIEIDRPAGEVFDYLADIANNPQWQRGQQHCRWTSDPPLLLRLLGPRSTGWSSEA